MCHPVVQNQVLPCRDIGDHRPACMELVRLGHGDLLHEDVKLLKREPTIRCQVSDDQMLPRVKLRKQSAWYNIALIAVVALTCFALGRFSVSLIATC